MSLEINKDFNISRILMEYREDIPILDYVILEDIVWGKLEILCNKYYGDKKYVKILMDFNDINNAHEMNIGDIVKMPDISYILNICKTHNILDEDNEIPGINKSTNNQITNTENKKNKKTSKTVANSKLGIKQNPVKYDKNTGKIIF